MRSEPSSDVSAIYVAKYNRFVDTILGRINKILRSNYDPVTVKLSNASAKSKAGKQKSKTKSKKKNTKTDSKKIVSQPIVTSEKMTEEPLESPQVRDAIRFPACFDANLAKRFSENNGVPGERYRARGQPGEGSSPDLHVGDREQIGRGTREATEQESFLLQC